MEWSNKIVHKGGHLSLRSTHLPPVERCLKVKPESYKKLPQFLQDVLSQLDLLVSSTGPCIIVKGSTGTCKTTVLRTLAEAHGKRDGNRLVVLHLGEQVDSKMLLGTYTSTKVPGEFLWLPGVLTKALRNGQWVLLEDIQSAPAEVITLLLTLVKNGKLMIPGYNRPLQASDGFKLLLTWRVAEDTSVKYTQASSILSVLEQHCAVVCLQRLGSMDIQHVLSGRFPGLDAVSEQLASFALSQQIHIRHILKFCNRVCTQLYDGRITSVEDFMLEAIDCFCGGLTQEKRVAAACELRPLCGGISKEKVEQLCVSHKPSLHISLTAVAIGRAHLDRHSSQEPRFCYAHTQSALCLLEKVGRCVQLNEPVLLVGETGVGKTAAINYLSSITGNKLVVINMSQQTDSSDLLGGFKPVQTSQLVAPYREQFERLFHSTFSIRQNAQYLASVQVAFTKQQWTKLFKLMLHSVTSALARLRVKKDEASSKLHDEWKELSENIKKFKTEMRKPQAVFSFSFVEGALVEAVSHGWWILLDEINLATPEVLQCLSSLLEGPDGSFLLPEKATSKPVERHNNFRLFCCMNPATDIGKKSLPHSIRNRFTEFFVDEYQSGPDLQLIVLSYLKDLSPTPALVDGSIKLYRVMKEYAENRLNDGTGRKPHYSMRSLCRALDYAARCVCGSLQRSLYEGFCMTFLSELRQDYHQLVMATILKTLGIPHSCVTASIPRPSSLGGQRRVQVEGFWLSCGEEQTLVSSSYVLVNSVKKNLKNLARVVSARKYPVLLQGPTSAGKTSLVQYLATVTGHKCLRINNHEHTDLQEYVGMYTANSKGQLVFQEGVLVNAMRNGYWIILDELNLAPTEVLEALNRVLDDNRELFIPETQQLVKAHPEFLVFGTQNPPGTYGGRKVLSRAFRNRFIELHFEDIPPDEVVTILQERCAMPPSYAKRMVSVMKELQQRRSISGIFSGKYGLITMRDLFRWAERYRKSTTKDKFYDWEQQLAEDGFMLLGGRLRENQEQEIILEVLQKHFKRTVDPVKLFGLDGGLGSLASTDSLHLLKQMLPEKFTHLVWTDELLKNAILLCRAVRFDEPVLLVGNTGCGKTTLCNLLSFLLERKFFTVNCHMHTEAADFLGGLGPVRNRGNSESEKLGLFEWRDGVVVEAMRDGGVLLIDEISLADDAVLERLNSVLEPERKLLVSERSWMEGEVYEIVAADGFVFLGTMNPGGDYGKKELSPALRNRFIEIWCASASTRESYKKISEHNLMKEFTTSETYWSSLMLDVIEWLKQSSRTQVSVRDLLAWVNFMNATSTTLSPQESFYHGACLVFLDGIGCGGSGGDRPLREHALTVLNELMRQQSIPLDTLSTASVSSAPENWDGKYGIAPFFIPTGLHECSPLPKYSLEVSGPCQNAFKLLRAMQLSKPLLLEGVPGVGKTTLVTALARASGHHVVRINLSEQTDISDLFGSDLPVEGGTGGQFAWRDGPCLTALKNGDWILLDEMNLASQSVLEGLNACLDHRGEIYIPELGMTFKVPSGTRFFACQNPLQQGGGRKGLPKSFTNRFTQVYIDALSQQDLLFIAASLYPQLEQESLEKMIMFTTKVCDLVRKECGDVLWEFNLRDVLRWCELIQKHQPLWCLRPEQYVELIYCCRLRDSTLRKKVLHLFEEVFEAGSDHSRYSPPTKLGTYFHVTKDMAQIGNIVVNKGFHQDHHDNSDHPLLVLRSQISTMEAFVHCVDMGWMAILVGSSCSGKSSVVKCLAELTGNKLVEFPMNSDTDTTELLGGFEQVNMCRQFSNLASLCHDMVIWLHRVIEKDSPSSGLSHHYEESLKKMDMTLSTKYTLEGCSNEEVNKSCQELMNVVKQLRDISNSLEKQLPYDIDELTSEVESLSVHSRSSDSCGQFEWVDSVLVKALKYGHWLLISHANFCSPSVLDRLNPLLEPGGFLSIDERGYINGKVPVVYPHPNFRLFLTMDHAHGEISRAMRNRGIEIYMLPEQSLCNAEYCRSDWLSLVTGCGIDDDITASQIVDMCRDMPIFTPCNLLHVAKSYILLKNDASHGSTDVLASLASSYRLDRVMEFVESPRECPLFAAPALNFYLNGPQTIVQRDLVPLLQVINQFITTGNCNEDGLVNQVLAAALQVFISCATIEDLSMRVVAMEQLSDLLQKTSKCCSDEVRMWKQTLSAFTVPPVSLLSQKIQKEDVCINQVLPSTNPLMTVANGDVKKASMLLELFVNIMSLERVVEEHVQTVNLNGTKSLLQLSYAVCNGVVPSLESLLHPSLKHIYFHIVELMKLEKEAILEDSGSNLQSMNMLFSCPEWMAVLVEVCSLPSCTLSTVACAWMLFKTHGLPAVNSMLKSQRDKDVLHQLLEKIRPLEGVLYASRFYDIMKTMVGCLDVPSVESIKQKNLIAKKDVLLRSSVVALQPLQLLTNQAYDERMKLLNGDIVLDSSLLNGECFPSSSRTINHLDDAGALQPAVLCLKRLILSDQEEHETHVAQLRSLLNYCTRISFIDIGPLLKCKEVVDHSIMQQLPVKTFPVSLIGCCNGGFDIYHCEAMASQTMASCGSACSELCFSVLAPQITKEEVYPPPNRQEAMFTIGTYHKKETELQTLLQYLWLNGTTQLYNPSQHLAVEYQNLQALLNLLLSAIYTATQTCNSSATLSEPYRITNTTELTIQEICTAAREALSDESLWNRVEKSLLLAYVSLEEVHKLLSDVSQGINSEEEERITCVLGSVQVHLGIGFGLLLSPSSVDPIAVAGDERHCIQSLVMRINTLIESWDRHYCNMAGTHLHEILHGNESNRTKSIDPPGVSLHVYSLLQRRKVYEELLQSTPPTAVSRVSKHKYPALVHTCVDLLSTLCAPDKVEALLRELRNQHERNLSLSLRRHSAWNQAVSASVRKLKEEYLEYTDVVEPFTMALTQMLHGMNSIAVFKKCKQHQRSLLEAATVVTRYHHGDCSQFEYISSLLLIVRNGIEGLVEADRIFILKRVILVALDAAGSFLGSCSVLRSSLLSLVNELLHHCWQLWTAAEERAKGKSQEDESLYRYKSKTHLITQSEPSEEEAQLEAMFPSYDQQFEEDSEIDENSREDHRAKEGICETDGEDQTIEFTISEMEQIVKSHFLLFNKPAAAKSTSFSMSSLSLVNSSYSLAGKLVALAGSTLPGLHYDYFLMGAHIRMCSGLLSSIGGQDATTNSNRRLNVYRDCFVSESRKVHPILSSLMMHVQELLIQWPDHPTLIQVQSACEKVLALDIHEPLMKILSGLEFVLKKAQDWEAYASSSVSLFSQLESLTQLVLEWRKLELNSWKRLLVMCADEITANASKWWFHLRSLCEEYKDVSGKATAMDEFICALQQLMETSTVGEFEIRLQIVQSFHLEMITTGCTGKIADILGNVMRFYQQFVCSVEKAVKELTTPIDKEFNEYLTILRWNDGNYWALKASAEKSHRALLKLVNKYKAVLHQPVKPLLSDSSLSSEQGDEGERCLQVVLQKLKHVPHSIHISGKESSIVINGPEFELTSTAAILKMSSFMHHFTTTGDTCIHWTESIGGLIGSICETRQYLQSTEFLKGIAEDKRRAAIKLNGLQKRKALSDLFKTLKQQGLSYRKGAEFCDNVWSIALKLPCEDLPNKLSFVTELWEGAQHCYYQCVARMAGLQSAFSNPSKELTMSQITRCKGYVQHLMKLVCEERDVFGVAFGNLNELWRYLNFMKKLESCLLHTVPIEDYKNWQSILCTCLEQSLQVISNFSSLVESMPRELDMSLTPVAPTMLPPLTRCGDRSVAEVAINIFKTHHNNLDQLYASNVHLEGCKFERYATMDEVADLKRGYESLKDFVDSLTDVISLTTEHVTNVGLLEFMNSAREMLKEKYFRFSEWVQSVEKPCSYEFEMNDDCTVSQEESVQHSTSEFREVMTELAREIVIRVQKVMIRHKANYKSTENGDENSCGWCKDLHVTSLENITDLRVDAVLEKVAIVVPLICQQKQSEEAMELLQAVNPLLQQYQQLYQKIVVNLLLTHFILSKLLLVLLQMFNTLAQKGFCTPPEETKEDGQGTEFVGIEAGGFDEGEGQKNVSSQAEPNNLDPGDKSDSQDETQKEKGDEQKSEEEDAVEMSEDFGGSLEDVNDTNNEEDSSEESDSEEGTNDHELGQLGSDEVDELDRNMWAPEEEEQKDEQDLKEQESGGGTSLNEETKIVAKEDADVSEQSPESPKPITPENVDDNSDLPEDTEHSEVQPREDKKEEDTADEADFGDLCLDDGEQDNNDQDEERSMDGSEIDDDKEESGGEEENPAQPMEQEEVLEEQKEDDHLERDADDVNALWAADQRSFGVDPNTVNPTENEQSNADATGSLQDTMERTSSDVSSVPLSGSTTGNAASSENVQQQSKDPLPHRRGIRQDNRSLADSDERAIKRPRLMQSHSDLDPLQSKQWNEDHNSYQHIDKDTHHHDAVVWDTANMEEALLAQHSRELDKMSAEPEEMEVTEEQDQKEVHAGSISKSENVPHSNCDVMESQDVESDVLQEEEMKMNDTENLVQTYTDTFFSSGSYQQLEKTQSEPVLRDDLKTAVSVFRSLEQEDQDVASSQLWIKYEMLMSSLSQMLSEELRLILLPTKATQLKGDFRTGKRLNMRRIIPYIASNFQNDRIWLRRTKPSKREYQILIAVDDSSSMNENNCNQMAYESLALISTALSRLDSGQLGVCRFGESVEILHPLGHPFTASSGGFILKQLTFTQTKTNFINLLEATQSIFSKNQNRLSTSSMSLEINQLLVILSDGRGVFADGSLPMEVAIRNLNQMGVFTVFIILDSLSKDSIVDIKVPTFIPGKPPIIKTYLDTFPFSFYVVLRDISKMPVVLGQALRQWFELISSQ